MEKERCRSCVRPWVGALTKLILPDTIVSSTSVLYLTVAILVRLLPFPRNSTSHIRFFHIYILLVLCIASSLFLAGPSLRPSFHPCLRPLIGSCTNMVVFGKH